MQKNLKSYTVLHLTDYGAPYEGNFVASLRALEQRLAEDGNRMVYVFPHRAGDMAWARRMQSEKQNVYLIERDGFFAYARQIRRLLRESGAEILHAHFIHYKEKLAALLAAKTCGHRVKTVLHLHNHLDIPKSPFRALPQRLYLPFVSRFICCSRSVANRLIADGVSQSRVDVAENAIAFERLDAFSPVSKESLGIPAGDRVALLFGFDFLRKGVDLAIDAVCALRASGEAVTLAIVLSSRKEQVEAAVLSQLCETNLPGWIKLLPAISDVAAYYHLADFFLSPSREEGFCYSLVEAAYCQTPVLASAIDAQKDLALPPESFVAPNDAKALSTAIYDLLRTPDSSNRRATLSEAKARVTAAYSLKAWSNAVVSAYAEIMRQ